MCQGYDETWHNLMDSENLIWPNVQFQICSKGPSVLLFVWAGVSNGGRYFLPKVSVSLTWRCIDITVNIYFLSFLFFLVTEDVPIQNKSTVLHSFQITFMIVTQHFVC